MLVEALQTYLAADSGMQAQLGTPTTRSDKTTGLFPVIAPSAVPMPYCAFQQVGGQPLQESLAGTGRLQTSRWRFSCYGTSYKAAKALAHALKLALISCSNYSNSSVVISGAYLQLEADDVETVPHATIYATHVDAEVVHTEVA